ncbi:MAG: hypothetical protein LBN34_05225 [Clostridiales Family XIII bacterium]|jgi:hypothetical protein|nr:hypothetical protein [Clostridiales Family XIII bacterium]
MATTEEGSILNAELDKQLRDFAQRGSGRVQAQISSFKNGLQTFEELNIIRVRGKKARLMIMEDYMPVIGEVDGDIDFIGRTSYHTISNAKGFFCHEHNVFFLLLKETEKPEEGKEEEADA